jgi:hypothetical protein
MRTITTIAFLSLLALVLLSACEPEEQLTTSQGDKLTFSTDTVSFDTVFSTLGSVTRDFRIYNPHDKAIKISKLKLAGGNSSPFSLNVDGEAGNTFSDIELEAKDSLYVFVRATIDPSRENLPFVVKDSVIFETNSNYQDVNLMAWGQNAHFHKNVLLQGHHVWTAEKPHVVYGYAIVSDTLNSSLTIEAGADVYMHKDAVLAVDSNASLKIHGTLENPVTVQGDRLEEWYDHIPGQWGSIWLTAGSVDNEITHAVIRNGMVGIRVDTVGNSSGPTLKLTNSIIDNMQGYGLLAQGSHVLARNTVFSNCGEHAVILNIGGNYDFRHCTIGNYWSGNSRQTASLALNNYYIFEGDTIARGLEKAYFGNSIVYGNLNEELVFSKTTQAAFNYSFENTLIKTNRAFDNDEQFVQCFNEDPLFREPQEFDFRLDTIISPAIDKGNMRIIQETTDFDLSQDKNGVKRTTNQKPDLGAYEFVEED